MSSKAIGWAFERRGLSPTTRNVLFVLADCADKYGKCWPSISTIAHCAEISVNTARKAVQDLAEHGLLSITARKDTSGRATSNVYHLADGARVLQGEESELIPQSLEGDPPNPGGGTPQTAGGSYALNHQKEEKQQQAQAPLLPEESQPVQVGKQGAKGKEPTPVGPLPPWLPVDAWAAFLADRKERRKPMTTRAQVLALLRLAQLRDQGHDPRQIIDLAIESGWQKFWPPKDGKPADSDDGAWRRNYL